MTIQVVSGPAPIVTLEQAKAHLKVESSDEDDLITTYAAAAQGELDGPDGWLGRAIGRQTLELTAPIVDMAWTSIVLPYAPIVSVDAVSYGPGPVAVDAAAYVLAPGGLLQPVAAWPWTSADLSSVKIRYTAGYETPPAAIVAAVLLMTADLYGSRNGKVAATLVDNPTVARLLAPFRVWS